MKTFRQVCVQPSGADNVSLPVGLLLCASCAAVDICRPPGPQQQRDRRTDIQTNRRTDGRMTVVWTYAGSAKKF